ncbi:FIGNL1-interacting regulator of recombination and mitosis [Anabrus simplex]|uniref:FIGNL1-interacting regulator of recombination and mitosis n=1 Tax=Anabrus simplex TaxID=316456 RepID=UPI0035A349DA
MGSQDSVSEVLIKLSHWSSREVKDNLNDVLPVLISSLGHEDQKAVSLQAAQALLASCLPHLSLKTVEKQLLQHVLPVTENLFMEALEGIDVIVQDTEGMSEDDVELAVTSLIQVCLELLSHLDLTLLFIETHGKVEATDVPTIPRVILSTLIKSFSQCKNSGRVCGNMFHIVGEAFSTLYCKSRELQTHFLVVLKDNLLFNCSYEQDICLLIEVLQLGSCIGEQVAGLGLQILASTWKGYMLLVEQYAEEIKTRLDVATPLKFLASEIVKHLINVVELGHEDSQLAVKVLKVAAFELKIIMKICQCYPGYLGVCLDELLQLLVMLNRYSLPSLQFLDCNSLIADNIEKYLTIGALPLLGHLISDHAFSEVYFKAARMLPGDENSVGFLLLTISICKKLLNCNENVKKHWMNEDMDYNILCTVFKLLDYCHAELCGEFNLPGIIYGGEFPRTVDLYEHLLCHVAGLVILTPATSFPIIEKVLLGNILQTDAWRALLAMDIWCIIARYGSADLCFQHVYFLVDLLKMFPSEDCYIQRTYLKTLISRLFPLLSKKHKLNFLETFPPAHHLNLWQIFGVSNMPNDLLLNISEEKICVTALSIGKFFQASSVVTYNTMLSCLMDCATVLESDKDVAAADVTTAVVSLWDCIPETCNKESLENATWLQNFLAKLCCITKVLLSATNNAHLLKVLHKMKILVGCGFPSVNINIISILKSLAFKIIENDKDYMKVINSIANIFSVLLQDANAIVCQTAYEVFAYFAHVTKHEQIVKLSVSSSKCLQKQITLYLTNMPAGRVSDNDKYLSFVDYLKIQSKIKFEHKCKPRKEGNEETVVKSSVVEEVSEPNMSCDIVQAIDQLRKDTELVVQLSAYQTLPEKAKYTLLHVISQLDSIT